MRIEIEDKVPQSLTCRDCGEEFIPQSCLDLYCNECVDIKITLDKIQTVTIRTISPQKESK